jgi:hypothetical protein
MGGVPHGSFMPPFWACVNLVAQLVGGSAPNEKPLSVGAIHACRDWGKRGQGFLLWVLAVRGAEKPLSLRCSTPFVGVSEPCACPPSNYAL